MGIIGSIGSGKTTLQKLILGFYEPDSGNIRIDGTDVAQIDPADLRRHIGYVPQDSSLFYGTVRDNIALKKPWADDEEVLQAARLAGIDEFISRHPSGYDMHIEERGDGLSGGQRQGITIARSLVDSPPIYLFDEPTSSMDNRSERQLLETLKEKLQDKTVVLVTHKASMLALVDRLLVIEGGKIIADGPKESILNVLTNNKINQTAKPEEV